MSFFVSWRYQYNSSLEFLTFLKIPIYFPNHKPYSAFHQCVRFWRSHRILSWSKTVTVTLLRSCWKHSIRNGSRDFRGFLNFISITAFRPIYKASWNRIPSIIWKNMYKVRWTMEFYLDKRKMNFWSKNRGFKAESFFFYHKFLNCPFHEMRLDDCLNAIFSSRSVSITFCSLVPSVDK